MATYQKDWDRLIIGEKWEIKARWKMPVIEEL